MQINPVSDESSKSLGSPFNRLWGASLNSNFADGLLWTAAPLLATRLTQSTVLISLLSSLTLLPWLFFAIPVGALVDRVDRRKAIAYANLVRFLIGSGIAILVASHQMKIGWLLLAVFFMGICEVVVDTTSQSMIPQLLKEDQLERGNSRLQISETVIQGYVGAPLSGFLYATSISIPFFFGSAGYALAALFLLLIPHRFKADWNQNMTPAHERKNFLADMKYGIKYLYDDKRLLKLVLFTTSVGFFFSAATSTIVLFLLNVMQIKSASFGLVMSVTGSGGIVGGILTPKISARFERGNVLALSMLGSSVVVFGYAFVPNVWAFMALGFAGAFLGGLIASHGLRYPFMVGGVMTTVISLIGFRFVQRIGNESLKNA